jgi:general stress protein 26
MMGADTVKKARKLVEDVVVGSLATVEGNRPRVRPIAMMWVGERELWFATFGGSRKAAQLKKNAAAEVCFHDGQWNHVRLSGRASLTQDDADRRTLFKLIPDLAKHFSGPTDPDYTLVKIAIERIEHLGMGQAEYEVHEF